jgi:hypothetical protein
MEILFQEVETTKRELICLRLKQQVDILTAFPTNWIATLQRLLVLTSISMNLQQLIPMVKKEVK